MSISKAIIPQARNLRHLIKFNCHQPKTSSMTMMVERNRGFFSSSIALHNKSVHIDITKSQKVEKDGNNRNVQDLPNMNIIDDVNDDEDEMEKEEMFVQADESLGHDKVEWGGPRRGGRLKEPTRFGDWERKGRCTDF